MRLGVLTAFTVAMVLAAGCSTTVPQSAAFGGAPSMPMARSDNAGVKTSLLYVATDLSGGGVVSVFERSGSTERQIGTITQGIDGPFGLFVDRKRNLYVANILNGTITVYPPGDTAPSETLTGAGNPIDVAVADDGTVYVANDGNFRDPTGGGTVLEYRSGETKPSKTIATFSKRTFPRALAIDRTGNVFVAYNRPDDASWKPRGRVLEFTHNVPGGKNLGIRLGEDGGLAIDERNRLVVVQYGTRYYFPPSVDIFAPGNPEPSHWIPAPHHYPGYDIALTADNTEMWLSCPSLGAVFGVTYPGAKIVETVIPGAKGLVLGVAASPNGAP